MSALSLKRQFMIKFMGLEKYHRTTAFGIIAGYVLQVIGLIAAGDWLLRQEMTPGTIALICLTMGLIATRLRGFNNIVHECSHATFTKERADNVLAGSFCASMVLSCYQDYRDEHMTHHQHLGDYDHDLDLQGIEDLRLHEPLNGKTILRHIVTPLLGMHLPYYLGANMSARDGKVFLAMKIGLIAAAFVFLVFNPATALLFVWVPFVWIYSALNYWTDCMDHGGLLHEGDDLDTSRNILAPLPVKVVLFPRNDCYHLVHHLFPQIPARHLQACHEELLSNPDYAVRQQGFRGIMPIAQS